MAQTIFAHQHHRSGLAAWLVVVDAEARTVEGPVPVTDGLLLGRDGSRDVTDPARDVMEFDDPTLSIPHASTHFRVDGAHACVVLRDLGSANGTRVNGLLALEHELHDGDRIAIGDLSLVYREMKLPPRSR